MNLHLRVLSLAFALLLLGCPVPLAAHPASGIVVAEDGTVFFQDAVARTIWKVDPRGEVSPHIDTLGGHWMALDEEGRFTATDCPLVKRVPLRRGRAQLVVADGGAPVAVGTDGSLYYGLALPTAREVAVGMTKIFADGKQQPFAPELRASIEELGITGICRGPDGASYLACLSAVMRVTADGGATTVLKPVIVPDAELIEPTIFLRGIAVDAQGAIYVAAAGCRTVLKITPDRTVARIARAEPPWTPTGVAVRNDEVYVLEVTNAERGMAEGWLPRVRKLSRNGSIITLASITSARQLAQPNRERPQ